MLMLMSAVETGQMSAAETGQMSAVETRQMLKSQIRGRTQNHQNCPKWVQNGPPGLLTSQDASKLRSESNGMYPEETQNPDKNIKTKVLSLLSPSFARTDMSCL